MGEGKHDVPAVQVHSLVFLASQMITAPTRSPGSCGWIVHIPSKPSHRVGSAPTQSHLAFRSGVISSQANTPLPVQLRRWGTLLDGVPPDRK